MLSGGIGIISVVRTLSLFMGFKRFLGGGGGRGKGDIFWVTNFYFRAWED